MSFVLAIAAIGSTAAAVRAECVSIAAAAKDAGATSMLQAVENAAESNPAMATLSELINRKSEVADADKLTIFAPTEAAYSEVASVVDTLDAQTFTDLVLNHAVEGVQDASSITDKAQEHGQVATELGSALDLSQGTSGDLFVSPAGTEIMAEVTTRDIETCVGIMHLVDVVLVPAVEETTGRLDAVGVAAEEQAGAIEAGGRSLLWGERYRKWRNYIKKRYGDEGDEGDEGKKGSKKGGSGFGIRHSGGRRGRFSSSSASAKATATASGSGEAAASADATASGDGKASASADAEASGDGTASASADAEASGDGTASASADAEAGTTTPTDCGGLGMEVCEDGTCDGDYVPVNKGGLSIICRKPEEAGGDSVAAPADPAPEPTETAAEAPTPEPTATAAPACGTNGAPICSGDQLSGRKYECDYGFHRGTGSDSGICVPWTAPTDAAPVDLAPEDPMSPGTPGCGTNGAPICSGAQLSGRQFECDHGYHRGTGADSGICVPWTAPEQVPRGMADPEANAGRYGN